MGVNALTIEGTSSHCEEVLRRIDVGLKRLVSPSAVVVFVLGRLGKQLDAIARGVRERHPGLCAVVAETEGLFTERGEIEGKDGYGCLLHSGRPARLTTYRSPFGPFDGNSTVDDACGFGVVTTDERTTSAPRGPCLHLFSEFPTDLGHNGRLSLNSSGLGWFGAVTTTDSPIWTVNADGQVASAAAARLEFSGLKPPLVANAACCRVVSQPLTVTAVSGTTLLELDQMPALVALGQVTAKLPERSWIVIALAPDESTTTELTVDAMPSVVSRAVERENAPIFRPLRGIDPSRGALVLREPLARGTRVAFRRSRRSHSKTSTRGIAAKDAYAAQRVRSSFRTLLRRARSRSSALRHSKRRAVTPAANPRGVPHSREPFDPGTAGTGRKSRHASHVRTACVVRVPELVPGMFSFSSAGTLRWSSQKIPGIVLGAFVVLVVGLLIVPLPSWLLDLLLAGNLALSVVVVLVTLYVSRALDIAVFPTLLLLTTLLRLGLNVASTRLILLDGYAGEVIAAFGRFVVRGNYAVGAIVFFVLCVIQYVVIAKGSERVAEVGARFVLDAMPGKQMAIDAETRSGAIDNATAKAKRLGLERESQFYGAMDGAMKFVKGDVIAGFIITFVNFVGGFAIGTLQKGLEPLDALKRFGLLTVGDGLVAQIPSIVLAVGSGILVTRVSSEHERQSLSQDFAAQLFGVPAALRVAGVFILLLALVPGLPLVPFFVIGALLLVGSWARERGLREAEARKHKPVGKSAEAARFIPSLVPWAIFVGPGLLPAGAARLSQLSSKELPELSALVESLRLQLFRELGVIVPSCRFELDRTLDDDELRVELREMTVLRVAPDALEPFSLEGLKEPLYRELRRNAGRFLGLSGTQTLLDALEEIDSVTVRQVVPKVVSLPLLNEVLMRLVDEGVSIRDLSAILTTLGRVAVNEKAPYRLTEVLREELKDSLCFRLTEGRNRLQVVVLDPTLEDMIRMGVTKTDQGQNLALSSSALRDVTTALTRAYEEATKGHSTGRLVLLTAPEIRRHTRKLIETLLPTVSVVAYTELLPELTLETLSTASLFGIGADD